VLPSARGAENGRGGLGWTGAPVAHQNVERTCSPSPCLREQSHRRRLGGRNRREPTSIPAPRRRIRRRPRYPSHGNGPEALRRCLTAALPNRPHPSTNDAQATPRSMACCIEPTRIAPLRGRWRKLRAVTARRSIAGRRTDRRSRKVDTRSPSHPTHCSEQSDRPIIAPQTRQSQRIGGICARIRATLKRVTAAAHAESTASAPTAALRSSARFVT
jgi:hypothetical protein